MPLIAVVARRAFACVGRTLRPGDRVEVTPVEAVVLVHARKAAFARPRPVRGAVAVAPPPPPVIPDACDAYEDAVRPKKRIYKRRNLAPEPE